MIYQIYSNSQKERLRNSLKRVESKSDSSQEIRCSFNSNSKQLAPFTVPEFHYDKKKLYQSLHTLNNSVQKSKQLNTYLATKILFSHGKYQTRKFLHRTRQIFGANDKEVLKKANRISQDVSPVHTKHNSQHLQISERQKKQNQSYPVTPFQNLKPNFNIRKKRQSTQIRQLRRETLGLQQAEIKNYQNKKMGISNLAKRKLQRQKPKDFKKMNMKGFAAKISASLSKTQKVNTKTLARLMNLNIKCVGSGELRKRCS